MAFRPITTQQLNERSVANFQELEHYFRTPRTEAEALLEAGMTFEDIKEYKRMQYSNKHRLQ